MRVRNIMKKIIITLLMSLIGGSSFASESQIEIEANLNNISSCLFMDEGLNSDGKNLFHKLSYICSEGIVQESILYLNDKSHKGSDLDSAVKFQIDVINNKNVVFSEFFMIVY